MAKTAFNALSLGKPLLKTGLLLGCGVFLLHHLDVHATASALSRFSPVKCFFLSLWFLASFGLLGGRIHAIGQGRIRFRTAIAAVFLGFFANSIFPARVGEGIKGLYLKLVSKTSIRDILTLIFWERFCDLNMMLLVIAVVFSMGGISGDMPAFLLPMGIAALSLWMALAGIRLFLRNYGKKFRNRGMSWMGQAMRHLTGTPGAGTVATVVFLNFLVWGQFILEMLIALYWVAGFRLPLPAALYVFIISSLAFAIPATPGGLGVYDAAIVFSLGKFGIPASDAMALALLMRTIQYVPVLAIGGAMVVFGGAGLQEIFRPSSAQKMLANLSVHRKIPVMKDPAEAEAMPPIV